MGKAALPNSAMNRLIDRLGRLPGIGRRSAERIAFHLLKQAPDEAMALAAAIQDLKTNVRHCSECFNLTEADPCAVCADPRRDRSVIMVVEQPGDVVSLESTGMFRGLYHVLMGRLSPLDGVGPGELNIDPLVERVKKSGGEVREVVLGTNPNLEGDGTALYLAEQLGRSGVKVSRLARGLPTGTNLETVSKAVLADAIQGRREMGSGPAVSGR
ncbi:MAG: recombination mediator RecR [Planctomycetes bacterium]|nr:recombination mediator RecR [Planctomycetota bacterium]